MYDNEVNKVYESYKEKVTPYNVKVYGIDEACIGAGYSMLLAVETLPRAKQFGVCGKEGE